MRTGLRMVCVGALGTVFTAGILAQQVADPNFDVRVAHPAYVNQHPKILFDEAHFNFHTATGRYKPLADLLTNDGYEISANREKLTAERLQGFKVLLIANALGAERQNSPGADQPAFTDAECDAVREWVEAGGALLLIADHAPFGSAMEKLALRFGVEMSKGSTFDLANYIQDLSNMSFLVFSQENHLLADHPITRGRDKKEQVKQVETFTGQSLKGPEGSVALLRLGESAMDRQRPRAGEDQGQVVQQLPGGIAVPPGAQVRVNRGGLNTAGTSAAGRAQGIVLEFGKGRVVVLGEAAMLTAQIVRGPGAQLLGRDEFAMGMNRNENDNRELALNIVHWLTRLI